MPSFHITIIALCIAIGGFSNSLIAILGGWLSQSPKSSESISRSFRMRYSDDRPSMKQREDTSPAVPLTTQSKAANTPIHKASNTRRKAFKFIFPPVKILSHKGSIASLTTASDDSPRSSFSSDTTRASVSSTATSILDDEIPIIEDADSRSRKDSFSTTLTNALADIPTSVTDRMYNVKNPFSRRSSTATPNRSRKNSISAMPSPYDTVNSSGRPPIRRSMTSSALADLVEESEEQFAFKDKRAGLPDITFTNPFLPTHKLNLDRPSRPTPKHRPSRMRNFILGETDLEMVNEKLSAKRVNFIHEAADLNIVDERLFANHEVHHGK